MDVLNRPELLKTKDVAKLLGVSEPTVIRLARTRKLGHTRIGTRFKFEPQEIQRYLTEAVRDAEIS